MSVLAMRGVSKNFGAIQALQDVDFDIGAGEVVGLMGDNGAGKSTLVKAALGLVPRRAGEVRVFGDAAPRARLQVAYVPQRSEVDWDFPASALDVVAMGLHRRIGLGRPVRRRHREEARRHLDRVGLADCAGRQIGQLSGGQRQRVFLARALAQDARLYLMDEPFAGVDAATEGAILNVLDEVRRGGAAAACVHHDLGTVASRFDHAIVLDTRLVAAGPVARAVTEETLQAAYGGRLAPSGLRAAGAAG